MANALASLGIDRGDRVATSLPNGLPTIVSFLAASIAGTAAPLNPGYREEEVNFYLTDTSAKILLCPPDGAAEARQAAKALGIPVYPLEMDATGFVRIAGAPAGKVATPPSPDDVALVLHTSGSTGRPNAFRSFTGTSQRLRRTSLRTILFPPPTCAVRHAAISRPRAGRIHAFHTAFGRDGRGPGEIQCALLLAHRARYECDLVFGRTHHSQSSVFARRRRTARGRGGLALHPLLQRGAAGGNDGPNGARLRRAGARSLRDDRSLASDGIQSAAAGSAKAGLCRTGNRRASRHHGRSRRTFSQPASAAKSSSRGRTWCPDTRTIPKPTRSHLRMDGFAPATRVFWTRTGT